MYLRVMKEQSLAETYVKEGWTRFISTVVFHSHLILESVFSLATLESKLLAYVKEPSASSVPFDVSAVPRISREQAQQESARKSIAFEFSWSAPNRMLHHQIQVHWRRCTHSRRRSQRPLPLSHPLLRKPNPLTPSSSQKYTNSLPTDLYSTAAANRSRLRRAKQNTLSVVLSISSVNTSSSK